MDEDKPNTDSDETWRYVFASAFVFSCCNSLRESVLRALWDMQVLKMFHGTKSMICSLWWQILIRKYCEGYSSSTGLKLCTNTRLVPLLKKKNVCWRVLLSAALTELDESKLVFSSSGDSGTENELMFSSYLGPPHPFGEGGIKWR